MTYEADCTLPEELLEQIAQEGLDVLPDIICLNSHHAIIAIGDGVILRVVDLGTFVIPIFFYCLQGNQGTSRSRQNLDEITLDMGIANGQSQFCQRCVISNVIFSCGANTSVTLVLPANSY